VERLSLASVVGLTRVIRAEMKYHLRASSNVSNLASNDGRNRMIEGEARRKRRSKIRGVIRHIRTARNLSPSFLGIYSRADTRGCVRSRDKLIAFTSARFPGGRRMIGQMRVEITGAKNRREKIGDALVDERFALNDGTGGSVDRSDISRSLTLFVPFLSLSLSLSLCFSSPRLL